MVSGTYQKMRAAQHKYEARTLLAKFSLDADRVESPAEDLSPGERTRALLAILAAREVTCLVLDEPTSALDVTIQKQVLALLQRLQRERGLSYLLRLRKTTNVKRLIERLFNRQDWSRATEASQGWQAIEDDLGAHGCAVLDGLMPPDDCVAIAALYPDPAPFRSRVVMQRHGFGRGEYRYFAYPLQPVSRHCARRSIRGSRRSRTAGMP